MATERTSRYIFSLVLLLVSLCAFAQKADRYGVALGIDLSRFAVPFINNERYGWELSADAEILKDMFAVVEIGSQTTNLKLPAYNYHSAGAYTRLGVDYNYMKHIDTQSTDKLFIGARYAFTTFFHEADNIILSNDIWGDVEGRSINRKWLGANWMEITTGMRAHLFNNFYLGWSTRFRIKVWFQNDPLMQPYYIPGYGRAYSSSWVGINYSLYYQIPLIKKSIFQRKEKATPTSTPINGEG